MVRDRTQVLARVQVAESVWAAALVLAKAAEAELVVEFSGLAADLWSQKLWSVEDCGPYIAAFVKNLFFAEDLGINLIRVDTVEPITKVKETGTTLTGLAQQAATSVKQTGQDVVDTTKQTAQSVKSSTPTTYGS